MFIWQNIFSNQINKSDKCMIIVTIIPENIDLDELGKYVLHLSLLHVSLHNFSMFKMWTIVYIL